MNRWIDVCAVNDLDIDRGACALVDGAQIAVFRVSPSDAVYALSNVDPFSGAAVMSRGIVGSRGEVPKVVGPMYKQSFDLRTGQCLDDPTVTIATYLVRVAAGRVAIAAP